MPSLLSSALAPPARPPLSQPLLLLQSSAAQTCLPVLRAVVQQTVDRAREALVLFCFLYPPSSFLDPARLAQGDERVRVVDRTSNVPGYDIDSPECSEIEWKVHLKTAVIEAVRAAPEGPLAVVIDSADTLLADLGSLSETARLLADLLAIVRARGGTSRLTIHTLAPSPLLPLLTTTRLSPALTHLTAHPPALLAHIASAYLAPPPLSPSSSSDVADASKFWSVFLPASARAHETERLVFGPGGTGSGAAREFVVEVLVRGSGGGGEGRRRGVERVLEGWSPAGPCELRELEALKPLWAARKPAVEVQGAPDPTQNLSFNLNLTPEQQRSRAQVPLPYAHEGKPVPSAPTPAAILYDPDSADDLDDDDPDEDLDI